MYSRNSWENRDSYSLPPGYDGSRFRRRRHRDAHGHAEEEVIVVPDSSYAPTAEEIPDSGELSVGGIPTGRGIEHQRRRSAFVEDEPEEESPEIANSTADTSAPPENPVEASVSPAKEKLSGILEKLGFSGGISSEDLLLCAVIFIIASDTEKDGRSVGDILLILALLLGIK